MNKSDFSLERVDDDAKSEELSLAESQEDKQAQPPKPPSQKLQMMLDALPDDDDHYANYDFYSPQRSISSAPSNEDQEVEETDELVSTTSYSTLLKSSSSKNLSSNRKKSLSRRDGKKNEFHDEERYLLNLDDFIYKPKVNGKIMQLDSMELQHSYGYDCVSSLNLCVADKKTLLYHCGHIIHMMNPYSKEMSFRRSSGKDGISFIAKNPVGYEIAIAEKGNFPDIVCYTWPDFNIISVLRGGAKYSFAGLDFSACGELMVSQSSEPDYLLTIWKWKEQQVYLSVKANNQRVYKTAFSPLDNSILLCCGLNHLKFWNIESTFTGMKIKGAYGKFGPADICNISTFIINKDNKIFSNCPWGNMFFWDGTTVKFEISRKEMQPAHDGIITFFHFDPKENNVFTAGMDGKIRVWDYEKMLNAWPHNKPFQMQPSFEREIIDSDGKTACPVQLLPKVGVEDDHHFFLQDKNGGIWMIDLSLSANADPWTKILETHAGPISGLAPSPIGHYFATLGIDGKLLIQNNDKKKIVLTKTFPLKGTALLWLPLEIDPTACVLILGFSDGTIRVVVVCIKAKEFNSEEKVMEYVYVIQALKPHKRSISCLVAKTKYGHHHVLSGSVDGTVFIYEVLPYYNFCQLKPLGFIKMPGPVTHIELKRAKDVFVFLVSTSVGTVSEVLVSDKILNDPIEKDTYLLKVKYKTTNFKSVKGCILRNLVREGIRKRQEDKLEKKKEELARLLETNPGFIIDEEAFLADTEKYEDLPDVYVPVGKTRINFAKYIDKSVWISPEGYDAGFFYEYNIGESWPNRVLDIPGTDRKLAIHTCISIFNNKYLLMGMSNGCIRLVKTHQSDPANLSDYLEIGMHVTTGQRITHLAVSCDNTIAYSCGTDGGIFSYAFNLPVEQKEMTKKKLPGIGPLPTFGISGIISPNEPSLEEQKAALREEKKKLISETIKMEMKEKINELADKYEELIERNKKLPESKRLSKETFIISQQVDQSIIEKYNQEIDDFKKKHEFEFQKAKVLRNKMYNACVKPIKTFPIYQFGIRAPVSVCTFREVKLTPEFIEAERITKAHLDDQERRGRAVAKKLKDVAKKIQKKAKKPQKQCTDMLAVIDRVGQKLFENGQMSRANLQLLNRITESRRERRSIHEHISELNEMKEKHGKKNYLLPDLGGNHANAQYMLKLNPEYRTPKEHRKTLYEQYWLVLKARRDLYNIKMEFNSKVKQLRNEKFNILREFQILKGNLDYMSQECCVDDIILPRTPNFNTELEFPEKLFMNTPPHCILDDPLPPISQELEEERKNLYGDNSNLHEIYNEAENVNKYINYTWLPGMLSYKDHLTLAKIFPVHPWRADMIYKRNMKFRERVNAKSLSLINKIQEYDKSLKSLSYERMEYEKKIIKTKLELYYLIQELEITRGFNTLEVGVKTKASDMIKMKHLTLLQISIRKKKINQNNIIIEKSTAISNTIVNQFLEVVKDNKYTKHLTEVFKKKYKPPKKRNDDDDSSSSSSFDEDFDDDAEGDDLQVAVGGAYLFDEKIRPDDCDPEIFEKTFSLRAERHVEEAKVNEARSQNQNFIKDLETLRKKLLMVETILAIFNSQMDSFLKCKQDACNKIWKVVVLKPSQIQHYNKHTKSFPPLNQCVLIGANTIRKLISKAEDLEKETQTFNKGKEKCKDHIVRLRKDIAYMKSQCQDLKNEKKDEMVKKFGMHVNMSHLEEVITSWIIQEAQQNSNVVDRVRNYMKDASIRRQQRQLLEAKKEQTNQYHELYSIQEERNKITARILNMQQTQKELLQSRNNRRRLDLESYLKELEKEVICQMAYKEYLLNQISALKFKQQPNILSKIEKKPYQQKAIASSISTATAMQNIVSDLVRKVIPSITETETPTEEYQEEEDLKELEEVSTEESGALPESKEEEELSPGGFAVEIIKDAIKGVIHSKSDIKAEELTDQKELTSEGSDRFLKVSNQSRKSLALHQSEEGALSSEAVTTKETMGIVKETEGKLSITKLSPEQEAEQDEVTISTYEYESGSGSLEPSIMSRQEDDGSSSGDQQSHSDSEKSKSVRSQL
ncbi:uncharacterized protein LOC106665516 [Cimex lectularius]|uniref:Cilia- and flagella-associated protein 44 n=1 Tax=Cimex lectularius TaxID=79782 RepID=A0A8I6RL48_CIMLE|nr:uncharacterized protein LOC106665516 [Cimex lectularius]